MGYGIIAVLTGIVTLELNEANRRQANTRTCADCAAEGHAREANYYWSCGAALYQRSSDQVQSSYAGAERTVAEGGKDDGPPA